MSLQCPVWTVVSTVLMSGNENCVALCVGLRTLLRIETGIRFGTNLIVTGGIVYDNL